MIVLSFALLTNAMRIALFEKFYLTFLTFSTKNPKYLRLGVPSAGMECRISTVPKSTVPTNRLLLVMRARMTQIQENRGFNFGLAQSNKLLKLAISIYY